MKIELILPDNAIAMTLTVLVNKGYDLTGANLGMNALFAGSDKLYDGAVIGFEKEMRGEA